MTGAAFGLLHAILTVPLGLSQHVSGLGVTLLASSATYFAYRMALPDVTSPPRIQPFQPIDVPLLSDLPLLGTALFQQTPLTWLALRRGGPCLVADGPHPARPRAACRRRQP